MKRSILTLATIALLSGAVYAQRTITVMGDGSAKVKPDHAIMTLTTTSQDNVVQGAFSKNGEFETKLKKAMADAGVSNENVKMRTYVLNPTYDYSNSASAPPKLMGYNFIGIYEVKITNLLSLPKVMDVASAVGATNMTVESYGSTGTEELEERAMKKAIADATGKAIKLAQEMGGSLGEILSITDSEAMEKGGSSAGGEREREEEERRGMMGKTNVNEVKRTVEVKVVFSVK
jgi:uncharacterized protein YggE